MVFKIILTYSFRKICKEGQDFSGLDEAYPYPMTAFLPGRSPFIPLQKRRGSTGEAPGAEPRSYLMAVKCSGAIKSPRAQPCTNGLLCVACPTGPCQTTGGKARLSGDAPSVGSSTKAPRIEMIGEPSHKHILDLKK